jgi:hypothetical protein
MILTEYEIDEDAIWPVVGTPIRLNIRNLKPIGSPGLFLKSFESNKLSDPFISVDSKCNIERRPKGIILHTNYSNHRKVVVINKDEVVRIQIVRGKERITPFALSLMSVLLKMGASVLVARRFGIAGLEYSIEAMELIIQTKTYRIRCIANGLLFEKQKKFLTELNLGNRLEIIIQPTHYGYYA